jgi:hypothetical protein
LAIALAGKPFPDRKEGEQYMHGRDYLALPFLGPPAGQGHGLCRSVVEVGQG